MKARYAGVLLPVTALPSPYGVGTFGTKAKEFVDFLSCAGQKLWQVLPLVPTGYGDSPYSSSCATAGSPYLIDIDTLIEQGLLTKAEAEECTCDVPLWDGTMGRVNYEALFYRRIPLLKLAFARFDREKPDFQAFLAAGEYADFAVFMALKEAHNSFCVAGLLSYPGRIGDKTLLCRKQRHHFVLAVYPICVFLPVAGAKGIRQCQGYTDYG